MNQCDGCRAGWPLTQGVHKSPSGKWFNDIGCTAGLYEDPPRGEHPAPKPETKKEN